MDASDLQARGVVPEILETVHGALLGMEDVDDHVAVIRDDPLAEREAVNAERAELVLLLDAVLDFVCDGLELRLGGTAADDEEIRERGKFAQIQHDDVLRLLL